MLQCRNGKRTAQAAIKDDSKKEELVEAIRNSSRSYEEIIEFLK